MRKPRKLLFFHKLLDLFYITDLKRACRRLWWNVAERVWNSRLSVLLALWSAWTAGADRSRFRLDPAMQTKGFQYRYFPNCSYSVA